MLTNRRVCVTQMYLVGEHLGLLVQNVGLVLFGQLLPTLKCRNHILLHFSIINDLLHRLQIHTFPISQKL
jgi:hypothetical protein